MKRSTKPLLLTAILLLVSANEATAFKINLKKVIHDAGEVVGAVAALPNPITTPIQIITGQQNPLHVKEYMQQQGQAIGTIANTAREISSLPTTVAGQVVAEVGGAKAKIAYDLVTGPDRLQKEFVFTAANGAAAILSGQDPLLAVAMPLAAAIRDAHSKVSGNAKGLPADVQELLGNVIPAAVIQRARYTTGQLRFSLPDAIIGGNDLVHKNNDGYAVTVDNVIVFSRELDFTDIDDLVWLGHELFHVKQYGDWGVDLFAFNYVKNSRAVEDQAKAAGSVVRNFLTDMALHNRLNLQVSHASASAFATKSIATPLGQANVMTQVDEQPGKPLGSVQQPVMISATAPKYTGVCVLNNEKIFITDAELIVAPTRGNMVFGNRVKPGMAPGCYFDLVFMTGRACGVEVTSTASNGQPLYGYEIYFGPGNHAGRCVSCTPAECG